MVTRVAAKGLNHRFQQGTPSGSVGKEAVGFVRVIGLGLNLGLGLKCRFQYGLQVKCNFY